MSLPPVEWRVTPGLTGYADAVSFMESHVAAMIAGNAGELIWLVEHPSLYTAGTSACADDLLAARFPVHAAGRGGQYTYHGPGQRIVYTMLDLNRRGRDVRQFVNNLEAWVIDALGALDVGAVTREGRVGVWVARPEKPALPDGSVRDDKIAAIGIKLRRWVSFHGISVNISPDLGHYDGIVPCGIAGHGITSLVDLGLSVTMMDLDASLRVAFTRQFGRQLIC